MARVVWVACQGFLAREACVDVLMGGAGFFSLWSAIKCPVRSFDMLMGLLCLWAACILKLRDMFLCCWRICVICLSLELFGPWVMLGFSVGMEAFNEFLFIIVPWSQEFSSVLRIWS